MDRGDDGAGADHIAVGDSPNRTELDTEPLGRIERAGAIVLGLASMSGGGLAVFASENQAGSAALLLVGAAFLLMGVQGTPLIRLGTSESGVELARRRRRVEQAIAHAQQEDDPAVAAGIVEATAIIEPQIVDSPAFRARLFESKVALALEEAGFRVKRVDWDFGADLLVQSANGGGTVAVDVKYLARKPLTMHVLRRLESRRLGKFVRTVLVTNAPLSPEVEAYNADPNQGNLEAITWRDERDTPILKRALMRIVAPDSSEPQD